MTADSDESSNSPVTANGVVNGGVNGVGGGVDIPGSHSPSGLRSFPSPWAQVVVRGIELRGIEQESPPPPPPVTPSVTEQTAELSDNNSALMVAVGNSGVTSTNSNGETSVDSNGNANVVPVPSPSPVPVPTPRRTAWNRPVNGVIEPVTVMGESPVAWPALSESTRSGPRSITDSPLPIPEGSTSTLQVGIGNTTQQVNANVLPNGNTNHGRTRSTRQNHHHNHHRGGGANSSNTRPPPPSPPPFPVAIDSSIRSPTPRPQIDNTSQRNPSRRGNTNNNFIPRPRGDNSYHNNNHGRRHEQPQPQAQFPPPNAAYIPPPTLPPYGPPLSMTPYSTPMGFELAAPFMYGPIQEPGFRPVPQPQLPPIYYPPLGPILAAEIIKQINYYFSEPNLVTDQYLRRNMDDQGWVPISLIANFRKIQNLTNNIPFILESMRSSTEVEVKGDKVRKRNDWMRWLLVGTPAPNNSATSAQGNATGESSSQSSPLVA